MKLVVKEPSENHSRRQLLPTPMYREKERFRELTLSVPQD